MQLFENVAHLASSAALYILGVGSTNGITFQANSPEKLEKLTLGNTFFSLAKVKVKVDLNLRSWALTNDIQGPIALKSIGESRTYSLNTK